MTIFLLLRLHNSRVGRSWVSIREDEIALGVNTTAMKVQAFAAGTFFAGVVNTTAFTSDVISTFGCQLLPAAHIHNPAGDIG